MAKLTYSIDEKATFINPYNFIPLEKDIKRNPLNQDKSEQLRTGVISCFLKVKTPLAIPDVESKTKMEYEHYVYEFMRSADKKRYMIPGSALRGPIRSIFETATNSCLSTMRPNTKLTRRMNMPRKNESVELFHPALLIKKDGDWELWTAKRYQLLIKNYNKNYLPTGLVSMKTQKDGETILSYKASTYRHGDFVEFTASPMKQSSGSLKIFDGNVVDLNQKDSTCQGYINIGEKAYRKKGESIFEKDEKVEIEQSQIMEAIQNLELVLKYYRDDKFNTTTEHSGYKGYEHAKDGGVLPIWYRIDSGTGKLRLSFAAFGRILYNKTLNEIVGEMAPCESRKNLCEACALFGFVGNGEGDNSGSRVRISDALSEPSDEVKSLGIKILKELSSPRDSYYLFYLQQRQGKIITSYDDSSAQIAGRKFYWQNKKAMKDETVYCDSSKAIKDKESLKRRASMEILGSENVFEFKVYYENITTEQLQKLVWSMNLGENDLEGSLCLKIGHGKPLGLGSVKIIVNHIMEREYKENQYIIDNYNEDRLTALLNPEHCMDMKNKTIQRLLKISNLDWQEEGAVQSEIRYPYIVPPLAQGFGSKQNDYASHQWYSQNKNKKMNRKPQLLPDILSADLRMRALTTERMATRAQKIDEEHYKRKAKTGQSGTMYEIGKTYKGTVKAYNNQKTSAIIAVDGLPDASLYFRNVGAASGKIDKVLPLNDKVEIKYLGEEKKNGNSYSQFKLCK